MSILNTIAEQRDALSDAVEQFKADAIRVIEDAERDHSERMKALKESINKSADAMDSQITEAYGQPDKPVAPLFEIIDDDAD